METIAFTGTRSVPASGYELIFEVVKETHGDAYVSGAALGVDTIAAFAALAHKPSTKHTIVVPNGAHNLLVPLFFSKAIERGDVLGKVIRMPEGTDFLDRDQMMIDAADILIAFPGTGREILRSGTWATVRRGREKGMPIFFFPLNGDEPWGENA